MGDPLIVVTKLKVLEGQLENLKTYYKKLFEIFEAKEPRLIAFHGFLNQEGTEATSIQVHPDTASMERHMQVGREVWEEASKGFGKMFEVAEVSYYGTPPQSALDMDEGGPWRLSLNPQHIAGFTRSSAI